MSQNMFIHVIVEQYINVSKNVISIVNSNFVPVFIYPPTHCFCADFCMMDFCILLNFPAFRPIRHLV